MPLVRLDVPDHLDSARVAGLADAVHAALVATVGVPAADRFQFVQRHAAADRIVDAAFPDLQRSRDAVVVSITLRRGRSDDPEAGALPGDRGRGGDERRHRRRRHDGGAERERTRPTGVLVAAWPPTRRSRSEVRG